MLKGFISYAHADRAICDALYKHLGGLHRTHLRIWRDTDLKPGDNWNELIGWHIKRTDVAVVLVSADALKPGGFVPDIEIPRLRLRQSRGRTIIVPAVAREYDRAAIAAISDREAIPGKGRHLGPGASAADIDKWCAEVAAELRALVESLPETKKHLGEVEPRRAQAQATLDALEACDAFYDIPDGLLNDCQKLVSGLQAALRAPHADIWAAVDGLAAKWAAFRRDRLASDALYEPAMELGERLDALLAALEVERYEWPPDLERASNRRLVQSRANPELVGGLDIFLERVEEEARILGQPGEPLLRDMSAEAGDHAVIGRALLVGPLADIDGARHVASEARRSAEIIEAEIAALHEGDAGARDMENARQLREAASACAIHAATPAPHLVLVPPGRFLMGATNGEPDASPDEFPAHEVVIDYTFAIGQYPVTFAEWDAAIAAGARLHPPKDEGWGRDRRPVINVSWEDAQAFLGWLNDRLGLANRSNAYRLPSEAEWEYACRGGTTTLYNFGNDADDLSAHAWFSGNSEGQTHVVGLKKANTFDLYDMHGNTWEWMQDCWNGSYTDAPSDGSAWTSGDCSRRVVRGGPWGGNPRSLRSARRNWDNTSIGDRTGGFRVARTL